MHYIYKTWLYLRDFFGHCENVFHAGISAGLKHSLTPSITSISSASTMVHVLLSVTALTAVRSNYIPFIIMLLLLYSFMIAKHSLVFDLLSQHPTMPGRQEVCW